MVQARTILESSSLLREMEVRSLRCDYKQKVVVWLRDHPPHASNAKKGQYFSQLRGLRQILNLQSTYMNRAHNNAYVMQKANQEINRNRTNNLREIKLFSELVQQKRCKLVGHILRTPPEDPLRQVSYLPNSAAVYPIHRRRVGGPRQQWLFYSNKYVWE